MQDCSKIQYVVQESFNKLKGYCEKEKFLGWDPYDGLNSPIIKHTPLKFCRLLRLAWIQFFKKSPINLRQLFGVPKGYNPKGLSLFLSAYCNLYKTDPKEDCLKTIKFLAEKLLELKTTGYSGDCWGYNFDWQSRLEFMPAKTPTVVATSFVGYSLLDAFDTIKEEKYLISAMSSCDFILHDLNKTQKENGFIFSYSPLDKMRVYNASLLGSRLLARAYSYSKKETFLESATASVTACAAAQREDGAWYFGEDRVQNWVDSFHTGYKLESISEYMKYTGDYSFKENLRKGADYLLENFFLKDGTPKYYDNKVYPIDIHCPAQLVTTVYRLGILNEKKNLVETVLAWTIYHMQDKEEGYFYYQLKKNKKIKIPFIRWAQAWMMYGMSFYLLQMHQNKTNG